MTGIRKAIEEAGGQAALGYKIGASRAVIWNWLSRGIVPAERCPDVELVTGVRCEELNPSVNWGVLRRRNRKVVATA